jgi:hypothetical protein
MRSTTVVRRIAGLALLVGLLPVLPAFAQPVSGLTPLLQVESTGITLRHFDVILCDICDTTRHIYESRQMTIFRNRSLVAVSSSNDLDDPAGTTSTVVSGVGTKAPFNQLVQALAAARPYAGQPGCSVTFVRNLPPPPPGGSLTLTIRHDYRLTAYEAGNTLRTFDIDSGTAPCPKPVRDLVLKAVAYHDSVASR